jgi:hypothetical protein
MSSPPIPIDWQQPESPPAPVNYPTTFTNDNFAPSVPRALKIAYTSTAKTSVTLTILASPRDVGFNLYFVSSTFIPGIPSLPFLRGIMASIPALAQIAKVSASGYATYADASHIDVPGWYFATGLNVVGDESDPCNPVANLIAFTNPARVLPPESASAAVTKVTINNPPGNIYPDVIYTLKVSPNIVYSLKGYQVYVYNYNSDPNLRESILIPPPLTSGTYATSTLRFPADAAGHTITFYFVPIALDGERRPDPTNSTSASIASGP